eukprot:896743-Pleurochrysis_carterae.AAC.2
MSLLDKVAAAHVAVSDSAILALQKALEKAIESAFPSNANRVCIDCHQPARMIVEQRLSLNGHYAWWVLGTPRMLEVLAVIFEHALALLSQNPWKPPQLVQLQSSLNKAAAKALINSLHSVDELEHLKKLQYRVRRSTCRLLSSIVSRLLVSIMRTLFCCFWHGLRFSLHSCRVVIWNFAASQDYFTSLPCYTHVSCCYVTCIARRSSTSARVYSIHA